MQPRSFFLTAELIKIVGIYSQQKKKETEQENLCVGGTIMETTAVLKPKDELWSKL